MPKAGLLELNAVVAVARHRSFRAAAAELGLSPSALSHAVATLEQRVGVRLFNRTTRSVSLSEAGERFLSRVGPALREISEAMEAVNEFKDRPTGTLRLTTWEAAARLVVMPLVMEFLRRYPEMHVELSTEDRFVDIVAEGFDAGVRLAEAVPQDMVSIPCSPDVSFAVVGAPRYFKGRTPPRTPGDLLHHACIRHRKRGGGYSRWQFEKRGREVSVDVKGPLALDNDLLMIQAALKGLGLAYVSEGAAAADLAAGRLVRVLEDWTQPFPGLCLYYPGHRHVPAGLKAFIGVIREARARRAEGG